MRDSTHYISVVIPMNPATQPTVLPTLTADLLADSLMSIDNLLSQ